jgi:hypothetical protein
MLSRLAENALRVTLCLPIAAVALSIQAISAAELIPCGQVSGLKSIHVDGVTAVPLTVRNGSTQTISIDWVDYEGAKIARGKIAPGEESFTSYACHAWLLHTSGGECLCGFVLEGRPEMVSIDANGLCSAPEAKTYEPTARYQRRMVEGWTILISSAYTEQTLRPVLAMVKRKLKEARTILPPGAIKTLQRVKLWLEVCDWRSPEAAYHPNADWLRNRGMNPDKAGGIQISAADIVPWSREQPAMLIHELAHAFEAQMREAGRDKLRSAFYEAIISCKYANVPRRGRGEERERAYAMKDVHEYFAELSEGYFLENDYYPFNREQLKDFDPDGFAAIERLWKVAK